MRILNLLLGTSLALSPQTLVDSAKILTYKAAQSMQPQATYTSDIFGIPCEFIFNDAWYNLYDM